MTPAPRRLIDVKLLQDYEPSSLARDLRIAERSAEALELPRDYHDGGWAAIPLISAGGRVDFVRSHGASRVEDAPMDTPVLAKCPYIKSLLQSLPAPKRSARFLYLMRGAVIHEHCDPPLNAQAGALRLHVPVITHTDVLFVVGGKRVRWQPGELWWADFSLPHSVENRSPVDRVHLVIDVSVTHELLQLFPSDAMAALQAQGITYYCDAVTVSTEALAKLQCTFEYPSFTFPVSSVADGIGTIRLEHGVLAMYLRAGDAVERFELVPYSANRFGLRNWPPCYELHFAVRDERVVAVTATLRGLTAMPTFVPLGLERINERRVPLTLRPDVASGRG